MGDEDAAVTEDHPANESAAGSLPINNDDVKVDQGNKEPIKDQPMDSEPSVIQTEVQETSEKAVPDVDSVSVREEPSTDANQETTIQSDNTEKKEEEEKDVLETKESSETTNKPVEPTESLVTDDMKQEEAASLFKGVNFCLCDNLKNLDEVKKVLVEGGGKLVNYLTDIVTHLIADSDDHPDVTDALEIYEKPVVTSSWVFKSREAGLLLPVKAFSPLKCQLFSNVTVCPSKVTREDAEAIWAMVTFHGGSFSLDLTPKSTHLIAGKAEGSKYDKAMTASEKIKIVTPDWILDSVRNKSLADEELYHPRLLMSPSSSHLQPTLKIPDDPQMMQASLVTAAVTTSHQIHPQQQSVSLRGLPPNTFITTISHSNMTSGSVQSSAPRQIRFIVPNRGGPGSGADFKVMHVPRHPVTAGIQGQGLRAALTGFSGQQQQQQDQPQNNQQQQQPRQVFLSPQQQPQVRQQNPTGMQMIQIRQQGNQNNFQQMDQNQQQFMQQQQQQSGQQQQQTGQKPGQVILQQRVQPPVHTLSQQNQQNAMSLGQQQHPQQQMILQGPQMMQRFPGGSNQSVMHLQRVPPPGSGVQQTFIQRAISPQQQQQQQQQQGQQMYSMPGPQPQVQRVPQVRMNSIRGPGGQMIRTQMQSQVITNPDGSQRTIFFRAQGPPQQQMMQGQPPTHQYHFGNQEIPNHLQGQVVRQPAIIRQQSWPIDQTGQMIRPQTIIGQQQQMQMMPQQPMIWHQQQQQPLPPQQQMQQQQPMRQMMPGQQPGMNQRYPHPDRMTRPFVPQGQQQQVLRPLQGVPNTGDFGARMKGMTGQTVRTTGTPTANIIPSASPSTRLVIPKTGHHPGHHASQVIISEPVPERYFTHDAGVSIPKELVLLGCVFVFEGLTFLKEDEINTCKSKIVAVGGEIESNYCPRVTHIVADSQGYPIVQQGLREGKRVVNIYWLDEVIADGKMIVPCKPWHLPRSVFTPSNVFSKEIIASSGFSESDRATIRDMCKQIGAKYTPHMSMKNTLLISKRIDGEKHDKAMDWLIPMVSCQWLTDAFLGVNDASRRPFGSHQRHKRFDAKSTAKPFDLDVFALRHLLSGWRIPIKVTEDQVKEALEKKQKTDSLAVKPSQESNGTDDSSQAVSSLDSLESQETVVAASEPVATQESVKEDLKRPSTEVTNDDDVFMKPAAKKVKLSGSPATTNGEVTAGEGNKSMSNGIPPPPPLTLAPFVSGQENVFKILFTMIKPSEKPKLEEVVKKLGAKVTNNPCDCTHVVVERPVRTVKFLSAMSHANFVVTQDWVKESEASGRFLNEHRFSFVNINESLKRRQSRGTERRFLFNNFVFFITPGVIPSPSVLKQMIESAGGIAVTSIAPKPAQLKDMSDKGLQFVVISDENDSHLCDVFFHHKIRVVHAEFVMTNLMMQEINFEPFELMEGESFTKSA